MTQRRTRWTRHARRWLAIIALSSALPALSVAVQVDAGSSIVPVIEEVDLSQTVSGRNSRAPKRVAAPQWRRIALVTREGRRGISAIDVGAPTSSDPRAPHPLWTVDTDDETATGLGTVVARPMAFATQHLGWVVAVATHDAPAGQPPRSRLWLLDAGNGSVLLKFELPSSAAESEALSDTRSDTRLDTLWDTASTLRTAAAIRHVNVLLDHRNAVPVAVSLYASDALGQIWRADLDGARQQQRTTSRSARRVAALDIRQASAPAIVRDAGQGDERWIVVAGRQTNRNGSGVDDQATLVAVREPVAADAEDLPVVTAADLIDVPMDWSAALNPAPSMTPTHRSPAGLRSADAPAGWRIRLSSDQGTRVQAPVIARGLVLWSADRDADRSSASAGSGGSTIVVRALRTGSSRLAGADAIDWPSPVTALRLARQPEQSLVSSRPLYRLLVNDATAVATPVALQRERLGAVSSTSVRTIIPQR